MKKQNRRKTGAEQEERAVDYLLKQGYRLLARNYYGPRGELDAVAEKDGVLVFLEIKYRRSGAYGDPLEAVTPQKQRRISRTALHYLSAWGYGADTPCRFDVVALYGDGRIVHIEDAFPFRG